MLLPTEMELLLAVRFAAYVATEKDSISIGTQELYQQAMLEFTKAKQNTERDEDFVVTQYKKADHILSPCFWGGV